MKKVLNLLKYWGQILLLPIYLLSFLIPRRKDIWLFGSTFGRRFADNPRYFYLYVSQMKASETRAIWITRSKAIVEELREKGYEAYLIRSIKGIYYALRGSVYFFDNYSKDISFWLSGGAKKINLWHGIPLKKIQMDNRFDKVRHPETRWKKIYWLLRRLSDEKPSHYVLSTSKNLVPIFSSAFRTHHVIVANYPRNDNLLKDKFKMIYTNEEWECLSFIKSGKWDKVILYMPTFRDSEVKFFDVVHIESLVEYLESKNILLCIKLHPKSKLKMQFEALNRDCIRVIHATVDPYTFLSEVDALVTDYSSIYFDFLLMDKPMIFFDYDRQDYLTQSRELYHDYDSFTPGRKVKNMNEFIKAINQLELDFVQWQEERDRIRREVYDEPDQFGSEQLYGIVKNLL